MLIRDSVWEKIRHKFSEEEKLELRKAVRGQAICPKGIIIDPGALNVHLEFRLIQESKSANEVLI